MELLEQNKIYLHNCDNMEYMAKIPDKFFQLACVDPPYGINVNVSIGRRKGDKKSTYHKFAGADKSIPTSEYFKELFRISQNQIIWGGNYFTKFLNPSPCWVLWDKGFSEDVTFAQFEMAWTSFNSTTKKFDFNAASNLNRIHPTQKPIALYKWLLSKYAKKGDKIFDSHLGSMSSVIAAYEMGFEIHGCELDTEYFEAGKNRVITHLRQLKLF